MTSADDYDFDYDDDNVQCPRCSGWGQIDCHCGGDLCVCDNYGDASCPVCGGDGTVTEARAAQYRKNQAASWAAYQAAMVKIRREQQPRPATTPKRAKVKAARRQRTKQK